MNANDMNAHDTNASHEALYCRIHDYVTAELEGATTAEQRNDFAELVQSDETARSIYVAYMQELASLRWSYASQPLDLLDQLVREASSLPDRPADRGRSHIGIPLHWAAAVAATLLAIDVTGWLIADRGEHHVYKAATAQVEPPGGPGHLVDERGIPAHLLGAEYVMPFNDDKQYINRLEVTLFVTRPASLYVFLSDAVDAPDWLKASFVDTGENIGLDEGPSHWHPAATGRREISVGAGLSVDTIFSIWKRDVLDPLQIVVGGVDRPTHVTGYNMYGIAAVSLE